MIAAMMPAAVCNMFRRVLLVRQPFVLSLACRSQTIHIIPGDNVIDANNETDIHDFDAMPGYKGLIGKLQTTLRMRHMGKLYQLHKEDYKRFKSKTIREDTTWLTCVRTCDPQVVQHIFRNSGKYPQRADMSSWEKYRILKNEGSGLLTNEGKEWARLRNALSKRMLKPQLVAGHAAELNTVATDMVVRMRDVRDKKGNGVIVPQLVNEAYKWAMESIGTVLFETRLGCLQEPIPRGSQEFIDAINTMFKMTVFINIGSRLQQALNIGPWFRFCEAWDVIFKFARELIDRRAKQLANMPPEEIEISFLAYMMGQKDVTQKEVYANITELLLAGVDTTSNTLCFVLHKLASNPLVQDRLWKEVVSITHGKPPTVQNIHEMPFLKAVVRETLRLNPIVTSTPRVTLNEMVVDGYRVPKGVMLLIDTYSMGNDETLFSDSHVFKPERWLRNKDYQKIDPFASLPFGFGVRSCIGRRIAELELYLLIAQIVTEFELKLHGEGKLKPVLRALLTPGSEIPVQFIDRQ